MQIHFCTCQVVICFRQVETDAVVGGRLCPSFLPAHAFFFIGPEFLSLLLAGNGADVASLVVMIDLHYC